MQKQLQAIYAYRSQIVHGTFATQKAKRLDDDHFIPEVVPYVRAAIKLYLADPTLLSFLKAA
ncbi:MAG: hypothetical protein AAB152_12040 [Candidatus Coatesbacteria bacterium]